MLNGPESHSGQIFKQNPEFFIIQDCVNQRKALFRQFDKIPGKCTSKTCQVETKPVHN